MALVERPEFLQALHDALSRSPAVALLGPRQCGKSTLARRLAADQAQVTYLDLERPADLRRLENPELALTNAAGLVVLDEIQRKPELFEILRVLIDLGLEKLFIVYPGTESYPLDDRIEVFPVIEAPHIRDRLR